MPRPLLEANSQFLTYVVAVSVVSGGRSNLSVAQMDYKANVDVRIKADMPQLAAKSTYLLFGYYPANMAFLPMMKPLELVCTSDISDS